MADSRGQSSEQQVEWKKIIVKAAVEMLQLPDKPIHKWPAVN